MTLSNGEERKPLGFSFRVGGAVEPGGDSGKRRLWEFLFSDRNEGGKIRSFVLGEKKGKGMEFIGGCPGKNSDTAGGPCQPKMDNL